MRDLLINMALAAGTASFWQQVMVAETLPLVFAHTFLTALCLAAFLAHTCTRRPA